MKHNPEGRNGTMMSNEWERALEAARTEGAQAGRNAAAWWDQYILGGSVAGDATPTARAILAGIDDGDPAILDGLPALDLSGQWVDGPTSESVISDVSNSLPSSPNQNTFEALETERQWARDGDDVRPERAEEARALLDELVNAYQEAYDQAALDECARLCRAALEGTEVTP